MSANNFDQTMPAYTKPSSTNYDLLYDKEHFSKSGYKNHFLDKALSFSTIHDGYILPFIPLNEGGVFDSEGRFVTGSIRKTSKGITDIKSNIDNNSPLTLPEIAPEQNIDLPSVPHNHSAIIYVGTMFKTWGHFITDSMRLLWFLRSKEYQENFSEYPIVYNPVQGFTLKGNWLRLLEILGIKTSMMTPIANITRYDKIIIPDECFITDEELRYFTAEYVEMIDSVIAFAQANLHPVKSRKIYYSYSNFADGKTVGEDKLEEYFASKGYEIIHPEKLSLDEQLNLLLNCESFASTVGSTSHNILFLRDNTEVIMIPRANYLTGYQMAIDQVHRQNIHYIDSSFSFLAGKSPWDGPFLYFISSNLRQYFHDEDTESIICPSDFWKYMRLAFGFKFSSNFGRVASGNSPSVYKYYSTIAAEYFNKVLMESRAHKLRMWFKKLLRRRT